MVINVAKPAGRGALTRHALSRGFLLATGKFLPMKDKQSHARMRAEYVSRDLVTITSSGACSRPFLPNDRWDRRELFCCNRPLRDQQTGALCKIDRSSV